MKAPRHAFGPAWARARWERLSPPVHVRGGMHTLTALQLLPLEAFAPPVAPPAPRLIDFFDELAGDEIVGHANVCPGCHAWGSEPHSWMCPDAAIERDRDETERRGTHENDDDESETDL